MTYATLHFGLGGHRKSFGHGIFEAVRANQCFRFGFFDRRYFAEGSPAVKSMQTSQVQTHTHCHVA